MVSPEAEGRGRRCCRQSWPHEGLAGLALHAFGLALATALVEDGADWMVGEEATADPAAVASTVVEMITVVSY